MANTSLAASSATIPSFGANVRTMSSREIAELTGKEHKNVLADIRKMLEELGLAAADFSAAAQVPGPNSSIRIIEVFNLPKRECLILVSGYSVALRAKIIDRWDALETGRAAPMSAIAGTPMSVEAVMLAEAVNRALRLDGSAALGTVRKAVELTAPALLPMLPVYAVDAPTGSESNIGSHPTASLTELLTQHNTGKSALAVNKLLAGAGLIEQMTRPTSRGAESKFWSVTGLGARWGKNLTSSPP